MFQVLQLGHQLMYFPFKKVAMGENKSLMDSSSIYALGGIEFTFYYCFWF